MPPNADSVSADSRGEKPAAGATRKSTATQFFLKGLAISLPPILTLLILVWIGQMLYGFVVSPITTAARFVIAQITDQSRPTSQLVRATGLPRLEYCGEDYRVPEAVAQEFRARNDQARRNGSTPEELDRSSSQVSFELPDEAYVPFGEWSVPYRDFAEVAARMRPSEIPATVTGLYMELATVRYFKSLGSLSALAVVLTIAGLYFLGRLVTARMGQWVVNRFESLVLARVPVISSVYSSVKQVTDFFFSERPIAYNRVVAVEFPRQGIWTMGFAMGESLMEMNLAAGEPMISVMIPAAPMPMTGWVVSVPKSSVVDLNVTLDQAFQYCLSCGVLVPEHQRATPELLHRELAKRLAGRFGHGALAAWPPGSPPPPEGLPRDNSPPGDPAGADLSRDTSQAPGVPGKNLASDEGTPQP